MSRRHLSRRRVPCRQARALERTSPIRWTRHRHSHQVAIPRGTAVRAGRRLWRGHRRSPNSALRRTLRGASRRKGTAFKPCPTTPLPRRRRRPHRDLPSRRHDQASRCRVRHPPDHGSPPTSTGIRFSRHRERTAWDSRTLEKAAGLYASGLSLADVADRFGIDAQTVANRFRRAGVAVRPRRGRPSAPV